VRRKLLALLGAAALVGAGCETLGGGSAGGQDPKAALTQAIEALADAEGVTVVITLEASPQDLVSLSEEGLTEEQAQAVLDSSITFAQANTTDLDEIEQQYIFDIAGIGDAVELRIVGLTYYARADIRAIAEAFGADTSQLDAVAQQAAAQGLDFIGPALDGDWIALTGLSQFQQGTGEAALNRQLEGFGRALDAIINSADVTAEDEDEIGEHLVASVPIRDTVEEFARYARQTGQPFQAPPPEEIPDEDARLDVWVNDEELRQAEIDLLQFWDLTDEGPPSGVERLTLRLQFEQEPVRVEEPQGAHEVNVQQLMQTLLGGAVGGTEPAPPTADEPQAAFCDALLEELESAPPNIQRQAIRDLGDQCPNLEKDL
jgi:hypothetical protein